MRFRSTFQRLLAKSGTHILEKLFEKTLWNVGSAFQNLRLGGVKSEQAVFVSSMHVSTLLSPNLCSPNEDFGRPNLHFRVCFRSTFQRLLAQIRYHTLEKCFERGLPQSSFGRGKITSKRYAQMLVPPSPSQIFVWGSMDSSFCRRKDARARPRNPLFQGLARASFRRTLQRNKRLASPFNFLLSKRRCWKT